MALSYFEAYHNDPNVPEDYLIRSAEAFQRVMELGVMKEYLYTNLYTIYYEMQNYDAAEQALQDYESTFPEDYMPHALRGMMLITMLIDGKHFHITSVFPNTPTATPTDKLLSLIDAELEKEKHSA